MFAPTITNPTGRKTPCHAVSIDDITLYFSYETLIGIRTPRTTARLGNQWGPTTGRHFRECDLPKEKIVRDEIYGLVPRKTRQRFNDRSIAA